MKLIKYLKNKGLKQLQEEFKIKVNRHQDFPHLVCLKYSQLESPLDNKIVQQCRGIILDEKKNWEIVSYPYDKFFNYRESQAAKIDWDDAVVYRKLDGSLMILYYYQGKWQVQSSGTPDGSGEVENTDYTFQSLFWQVWQQLGYELPATTQHCFMFELLTPHNQIVVRQDSNKIVLHGVRNLTNLQEENPLDWSKKTGWEIVETYSLKDLETVIEQSKHLDPMESEGYIVCDKDFNRIKIKSPKYISICHLSQGITKRKMLNIMLSNEGDEFLSYFPQWQKEYDLVLSECETLAQKIEIEYSKYKDIESQKDFAIKVKHLSYSGILFSLRSGKFKNPHESLRNISIDKLESLLEEKC